MTDLDSLRRAAITGVAPAIAVGIVTAPMYFAAFGFDLDAAARSSFALTACSEHHSACRR